jgi:hypothetical protein
LSLQYAIGMPMAQILICLSRNWYGYGGKFLYFGSYQGKALQTGISWRRWFRLL